MRQAFTGADIFDGTTLHRGACLVVDDGHVRGIEAAAPADAGLVNLGGGTLAPGLLDLQVNGGGGVMVDGTCTRATLETICAVQGRLGATGVLPTLITDTPEATTRVITAGREATQVGVPGFLGLHLEGPHLDPRRQGAHDPALIRPMSDADLVELIAAAKALPVLMVTLAPASASEGQIAALAAAGAIVSLGHAECTLAEARAAMAAGATCATHLFNAMSQLGNRAPGLVGAVLTGQGFSGLIADGIHVDPVAMRVALAAKTEGIFLISDCMAVAGTDLDAFTLGNRQILRRDGRLTLADGTLAGADLTLPQAIRVLIREVGLAPERALAMATSVPAAAIRVGDRAGHLLPGRMADMVHLTPDWQLAQVWRGGAPIPADPQ